MPANSRGCVLINLLHYVRQQTMSRSDQQEYGGSKMAFKSKQLTPWGKTYQNSLSNIPDDYGERDRSLQSYNNSSMSPHFSLDTAEQLICDYFSGAERFESSTNESGVFTIKFGQRSLSMRVREDVQKLQISTILYDRKSSPKIMHNRGDRKVQHMLLTAMMRLNIGLRWSCGRYDGGQICALRGCFIFFQDLPVSILYASANLESELQNIVLKTKRISLDFDRMVNAKLLSMSGRRPSDD